MASFADDFNRADSTSLGAGWVEVSGDWSIISNRLSSGNAGGTVILRAAGAMASNDHSVQVTIAATAAVSHGVWARGNSNISQGYLLRNDGSSWDLFSVVGGSFSVIGSYAVAAVAGDVVKLQVVGSAIKGYINGTQRISVTDAAVTTGTSVGIRAESTSSLRFDDFAAADVTAGATLGTAAATETAQTLTGSKSTALSPAAAADTAQTVTGTKAGSLLSAAASESAQTLAGAKTIPLGAADTAESAQPLTGSKTAVLPPALEAAAAQTLAGTKTAPLPTAAATETAQPLTVAAGQSIGTAASIEAAQPLTGVKSATIGPALETSTARPLVTAGGIDLDVDVTVGAPYSPWSAGEPYVPAWTVETPQGSDWEVGAPC